MHSSRMHTSHSLTVCCSLLPRGVSLVLGGVCLFRGVLLGLGGVVIPAGGGFSLVWGGLPGPGGFSLVPGGHEGSAWSQGGSPETSPLLTESQTRVKT